jgi:hypothetical protein
MLSFWFIAAFSRGICESLYLNEISSQVYGIMRQIHDRSLILCWDVLANNREENGCFTLGVKFG